MNSNPLYVVIIFLTSSVSVDLVTSQNSIDHRVCCPVEVYQDGVHMHCRNMHLQYADWTTTDDVQAHENSPKICVTAKSQKTMNASPKSRSATVSVTWLDLSANALKSVPKLYHASFTAVQQVNLSRNQINEGDEDTYSGLISGKHLTTLDLSYNDISSLPAVFKVSKVSRDSQLTFVDLSHNALTFLQHQAFGGATELTILNLSYNQLAELTSGSFASLTSLVTLNVDHNHLEVLPVGVLDDLQQLKHLDLSYNQLNSLPQTTFHTLRNLQELSLRRNTVTDLASNALHSLKLLKVLDMSHNKLSNLPGDVFEKLSTLAHMDLSHNHLKAVSVNTLKGLDSLKHLDLSHNELKTLRKAAFTPLRSLIWLSLKGNRLSRLNEHTFAGLRWLSFLDLSHNDLQLDLQTFPTDLFAPLVQINHLRLHGNDHRREGSYPGEAFASLSGLRHLSLDTFADVIFGEEFVNFRQLRTLELPGCKVERLTRDTFRGFESSSVLTTLAVHECPLREVEDCALCGLTSLEDLTVTKRTSLDAVTFLPLSSTDDKPSADHQPRLVGVGNMALSKMNLSGMHLGQDVIQSVVTAAFRASDRLLTLDLSLNDIAHINLTLSASLKQIHISGNSLTSLPAGLVTLKHVTIVDVSNNNISALTWEETTFLTELATHHKVTLKLSGNRIACPTNTCEHVTMFDWLCSTTNPVNFADDNPCDLPCWPEEDGPSSVREAWKACVSWLPLSSILTTSILATLPLSMVIFCFTKRRRVNQTLERKPKLSSSIVKNCDTYGTSDMDSDISSGFEENEDTSDHSSTEMITVANLSSLSTSEPHSQFSADHDNPSSNSTSTSSSPNYFSHSIPELFHYSTLSNVVMSVKTFCHRFEQRNRTEVKRPFPTTTEISDSSSDDQSQAHSQLSSRRSSQSSSSSSRRKRLSPTTSTKRRQRGEDSQHLTIPKTPLSSKLGLVLGTFSQALPEGYVPSHETSYHMYPSQPPPYSECERYALEMQLQAQDIKK